MSDIAIKVTGVSKDFRIPHEKVSSLRGAAVSLFKRGEYEEFKALDEVSFEVKKGEFFGIIGRNGSGKSTLLKILAGIYQTDKGKIHIDGMISPFLELGIGFNPELSGRDNIYLNATVLGLTKKQIDRKFDSIVKFSELERFIDQKLKNYSSGMQVRLAFSVSIHANRDILLMDEVLAVGDSNFQSKCLEEFNKYKKLGKTVILVSHDIYTIQRYCGRAMLLRNGRIAKIGEPNEVTREYLQDSILDHEKRFSSEESLNGDKRRFADSNKIAEVAEVDFADRHGSKKNVFETGELLRVDILYKIKEKMKNPIFGIIIRDGMKNNVYSLNTRHKNIHTGDIVAGAQKVSFLIENFFSTGDYSVSAAIALETGSVVDWADDLSMFKVINPDYLSNAIADFDTKIIIS